MKVNYIIIYFEAIYMTWELDFLNYWNKSVYSLIMYKISLITVVIPASIFLICLDVSSFLNKISKICLFMSSKNQLLHRIIDQA